MENAMPIIIGLLVFAILVGVPALYAARAWKKAEQPAELPEPDLISKRTGAAFHLFFWGADFLIGSCATMITSAVWMGLSEEYGMLDRLPVAVAATMIPILIGGVLLIVGRVKLGEQTRILEHGTGRELTPLERYLLFVMNGIESEDQKTLFIHVARATGNKVDDVASAAAGVNLLLRMGRLGRLYTGSNFVKNHWPLIPVLALAAVFVVLSFTS